MLKRLFMKIFIFLFTFISLITLYPYNTAFSSASKTYIVPIKLSNFTILNKSLTTNLALIKTAIIKENAEGSTITISFETANHSKYILDINIYDNNNLKPGVFFYRYFDKKSKSYITQVQFERKSKKENQIKINITLKGNDTSTSDAIISLDWSKAKLLNTKKFPKNKTKLLTNTKSETSKYNQQLVTSNTIINNPQISKNEGVSSIKNTHSTISKTRQTPTPIDRTLDKSISNPAKMQDYISYYNNINRSIMNPTTSLVNTTTAINSKKIEESPEDILDETNDINSNKKTEPPILRSVSDFFASDSKTKSAGSYIIDISSIHLNPLTGKQADENSEDENLIKILAAAIITPNIENGTDLKEILRQEPDNQEKKWARAQLERKGDKLYARVRLHLANHITRSQEEGPFFKVLQENGQYELVTATESHLNINKDGDSYADYTFEVPRENFSAMVQLNIESLNKTIRFFLEVNPRTIKKGSLSDKDISQTQPASPLVKTGLLASVLLIVITIPLLAIKRKRQLEEDEYEDYDDEDEDY